MRCASEASTSRFQTSGGTRSLRALVLWAAASSMSCGDGGQFRERDLPLVTAGSWRTLDSATDVFTDHVPEVISCAPRAIISDAGALDINTDDCNYLFVGQRLPHRLDLGDRVIVEAGHLVLFDAAGSATGHIALSIDGHVLWERSVLIPAQPALYVDEVIVDRDFEVGSRIELHLHNHGANEWRFYSLVRRGFE